MEQFDDIFRENVHKAFSDYNADHLADQGWNSLETARRERRRRMKMIVFWARAASIALLVGAGVFIGYLIINRQPGEEILSVAEPGSEMPVHVKTETASADPVPEFISEKSEKKKEISKPDLPAATITGQPAVTEQLTETVPLVNIDTAILPVVAESRLLISEDSVNLAYEEALKEFLEGEQVKEPAEEKEKRPGRTTFMTGLSGLLAHVKDASSAGPGMSVGFYVDQKITERISLRPGLALAINSLGVDNGTGNHELAYSVPLIDGNSGTPDSYNGHLSMLAMEIPLNVVFKVYEKERSGIYLSAGASTMVYISQQFTGDFVNEYTMASENRYSTVTVDNSYGAFSRTDYLGLANFSAGYTFPYGKTGTLLIEPFMQLPFSDLTSLNLRVRYGGISMKIRFGRPGSE